MNARHFAHVVVFAEFFRRLEDVFARLLGIARRLEVEAEIQVRVEKLVAQPGRGRIACARATQR